MKRTGDTGYAAKQQPVQLPAADPRASRQRVHTGGRLSSSASTSTSQKRPTATTTVSQKCHHEAHEHEEEYDGNIAPDEYYQQYLDEVYGDGGGSDDDDRDLDVSTPSEWRAAANSPLRGSAKRTVSKGPLQMKQKGGDIVKKGEVKIPQLSDRVMTALYHSATSSSSKILLADDDRDVVQSALLDCLSAVSQRPNRLFVIAPSGMSWERTATCKQLIEKRAPQNFESLARTLESFFSSCQRWATSVLVLEVLIEMIHPSKWVLPEESFVIERWTASGSSLRSEHYGGGGDGGGISSSSSSSLSASEDDEQQQRHHGGKAPKATTTTSSSSPPPLSSYQALRRASYMSMLASHRVLRQMLEAVMHEVLVLQQNWCARWWPPSGAASSSSLSSPPPLVGMVDHHTNRTTSTTSTSLLLTWERSMFKDLRELHQQVELLLQPLRTLSTLFSHEPTGDLAALFRIADSMGGGWVAMAAAMGWEQHSSSSSIKASDHNIEKLCAVWIDSLVWHCSKQQGTCWAPAAATASTSPLPSPLTSPPSPPLPHTSSSLDVVAPMLHMMLLTTTWPYVETLVWVIVGAVPHIDEEEWLRRCPNMFASPFPQPRDPHAASLIDFDDFNDNNLDGGAARRQKLRENEANFVAVASAVSVAAGCEGITRYDSWRTINVQFQNSVKHVLLGVERSLTAAVVLAKQKRSAAATVDGATNNNNAENVETRHQPLPTLRPLSFSVAARQLTRDGKDALAANYAATTSSSPSAAGQHTSSTTTKKQFVLRCNFDALGVGITCREEAMDVVGSNNTNNNNTTNMCLVLDTATPVSQWAITAILHPLAQEAAKRQREAVSELLTKRVRLPNAPLVVATKQQTTAAASSSSKGTARNPYHNHHAYLRRRSVTSSISNNADTMISFVNSVDLLCQHALFAGECGAAFGQAFVDAVAALPAQWWTSGETMPLLSSAYYTALLTTSTSSSWSSSSSSSNNKLHLFSSHHHPYQFIALRVPEVDPNAPMIPHHMGGLLRVIQSATLSITLPQTHAVILLPHLYYNTTSTSVGVQQQEDCYSKVMRLLTVLLLAKDLLLRRWKDLRWGSSSSTSMMDAAAAGSGGGRHNNSTALLAVGAMHLSFVINAVVDFVSSEVRLAVSNLKSAVLRERSNIANICRATDEFIAHLELVSLQQHHQRARTHEGNEGAGAGGAALGSQLVFEGIASVVRLALEFAWSGGAGNESVSQKQQQHQGVIASLVAPRVKSSASQLIAALRAVPIGSPLFERVQPLLLRLTFNGYFGGGGL